ncbi:MAG: ATP-binding protein [Clostridium sp.]|nr:ATP-binding protein [Clostridium sp.]
MLLKYIVSNYKSIGHQIQFSMFPTEENTDERYLTTISTKMGEWKILRRGGFFGPNAAGKSVFIQSMEFAKDFITEGKKSGKSTGVVQFAGGIEELANLSTFQFMIYVDGEVYDYGFSLDKQMVHEEWLMILDKNGFQEMFTRLTNEENKTRIHITSKFARNKSKQRELAEVLKESMQENQKNQLFLYKLFDNGIKRVESIVEWFENVRIIYPNTKLQGLPIRIKTDDELRKYLSDSLNKLDTGVYDVSTSEKEMELSEIAQRMDMPKELIDAIEEKEQGILSINGKYYVFLEKDGNTIFMQLEFKHLLNNRERSFDIEDESDGTQRLLDLLPILFQISNNSEAVYFVDELDRSLHTKLSKYFLKTFVEAGENGKSQIIFTAHDVNLINLTDFRQEELWFIEKNVLGESKIKPLSDFDINEGQNMLKDYVNGRFGAVPVIRGDNDVAF